VAADVCDRWKVPHPDTPIAVPQNAISPLKRRAYGNS
jgi:hypothetical protein